MAAKKKGAGKAPAKKFDPTVGGWIYNRHGVNPFPADVDLEARLRDGRIIRCHGDLFGFGKKHKAPGDVIWFRKARKPRRPKAEPTTYNQSVEVIVGDGATVALPMTGDGDQIDMTARSEHQQPSAGDPDETHLVNPDATPTGPGIILAPRASNGSTVWIVGRFYEDHNYMTWDFQGVFIDQKEADAACLDENWFVGPAIVGQVLPEATSGWPGLYYPKVTAVTYTEAVPLPQLFPSEEPPELFPRGSRVRVIDEFMHGSTGTVTKVHAGNDRTVELDVGWTGLFQVNELEAAPADSDEPDPSRSPWFWLAVGLAIVAAIMAFLHLYPGLNA